MRTEVTPIAAAVADPMAVRMGTIHRTLWETDDTFTITLETARPADVRPFRAGQFNMLYVFGLGEVAISISSDPGKPGILAHTIHRVGLVTSALSQMRKGEMIGIRGPFGSSWPLEAAQGKDVCIVAGGIGLAPLRPVMFELLRHRSSYGRIMLLYGARSPLDLLFRVELEQWGKHRHVEILSAVDRGDSSWKGNISVVTGLFSYIKLDARETVAFVCGPEMMMRYTLDELERRGVPDSQMYLSMERNMKCAVGFCGHCQFGPTFICREGPVYPWPRVKHLVEHKEM